MSDPDDNLYSLALTGGIACGKSTVGVMLEAMGLTRVDSDQIAREVVRSGTPGLAAIVERFGEEVLLTNGQLNRPALADIVFASTPARRDLERILHPLIWQTMFAEMETASRESRETVFEIPLLFENGNQGRFATVWVVAATPEVQMRRLQVRDGLERQQAEARLASQMSLDEKIQKASYVIRNDGDKASLEAQVRQGLELWRDSRVLGREANAAGGTV